MHNVSQQQFNELLKAQNFLANVQLSQMIAGSIATWQSLLSDPRLADPLRLERHGQKYYSQNDEDGMLVEIFRRIGVSHRRFVEFGVGDGLENNTTLWLKSGWSGLWLEADGERVAAIRREFAQSIAAGALQLRQTAVTAENIDAELAAGGASGEIDLLSVDIDGNDYHVFEAITVIDPRVVVIEFNGKFPPPLRWKMPYDPNYRGDSTDYFSASLQSMTDLFEARGYRLVGCNITGINAFFVRADLVGDKFAAPATAENLYQPPRYHLTAGLFGYMGGHRPTGRRGITE